MQDFTEEHANALLSKEWLTKVDNERSTAYLFKFHSSTADLSCCIMATDTRLVWSEVLSSKQFARRWRSCNQASDLEIVNREDEDAWRTGNLELLSRAHTLGGIADISFRVIESDYSDLAFQLECGGFVWRWETNYLGHKRSSEIISKHLILPLISLSHMAVTSSESVSEMSDMEVEKAVDRMGRTARRTVDTHIKHALSKPRMATTIRRVSAMFNFALDPPSIFSAAETPSLEPEPRERSRFQTPNKASRTHLQSPSRQSPSPGKQELQDVQMDSATESEPEESPEKKNSPARAKTSTSPQRRLSDSRKESVTLLPPNTPPAVLEQAAPTLDPTSESETSPVRPLKKHKAPVSTEEDGNSEAERQKNLQQVKSGNGAPVAKRTVRQPIKRGGKRF
ncbi:hypothetical protein M378DRAFT_186730 [Amanita muscaria Koide BX008]|uniref:XLF-like N-terminal domain-containing protein n=1 Tax=Amanita muscaria (strain Koide BX008) TaxID=946122 RepID=A0A0C2SML3_AMAMK|nr:hypothetical protein M378DRAFT_186730 [Amanita muscaria Koide BX008]